MRSLLPKRSQLTATTVAAALSLSAAVCSAQSAPSCTVVVASTRELAMMFAGALTPHVQSPQTVRTLSDDAMPATQTARDAGVGDSGREDGGVLGGINAWRQRLRIAAPEMALLATLSEQTGCTTVILAASGDSVPAWQARRYRAESRALDPVIDFPFWSGLNSAVVALLVAPAPTTGTASTSSVPAATGTSTTLTPPVTSTSPAATSVSPSSRTQNRTVATQTPPASPPRTVATTQDPRVTVPRATGTTTSTSPWPWVAAGVAGAALVAGFFIVQSLGPSSPVVHITGPGTGP